MNRVDVVWLQNIVAEEFEFLARHQVVKIILEFFDVGLDDFVHHVETGNDGIIPFQRVFWKSELNDEVRYGDSFIDESLMTTHE